jgi:hypothetical protein
MVRTGTFCGRVLAGAVGIWLALGASPATGAGALVWGTVDSPNQGDLQNNLADVKSLSFSDVWVVGEWNPGVPPTETGRRTLTEHWDGSAFSIIPSPNADWAGVDKSTLAGVSGVASRDVWAVGYGEDFASLKSTTLTDPGTESHGGWSPARTPAEILCPTGCTQWRPFPRPTCGLWGRPGFRGRPSPSVGTARLGTSCRMPATPPSRA